MQTVTTYVHAAYAEDATTLTTSAIQAVAAPCSVPLRQCRKMPACRHSQHIPPRPVNSDASSSCLYTANIHCSVPLKQSPQPPYSPNAGPVGLLTFAAAAPPLPPHPPVALPAATTAAASTTLGNPTAPVPGQQACYRPQPPPPPLPPLPLAPSPTTAALRTTLGNPTAQVLVP